MSGATSATQKDYRFGPSRIDPYLDKKITIAKGDAGMLDDDQITFSLSSFRKGTSSILLNNDSRRNSRYLLDKHEMLTVMPSEPI
jgi:hypothetical protein